MRRIGVVTENEIISGDVVVGSRIGNVIDEPYRSYGYDAETFKKVNFGKKFSSVRMGGEILRYDRYSGTLRRAKDGELHIPFGFVSFIYGIGKDAYEADSGKQFQQKFNQGRNEQLFRFRLRCALGRFELEGDCQLGLAHYLTNPLTGKKEITSFPEGFMTLKNPKILTVNKKLKYLNTTTLKATRWFDLGGTRFDIYEEARATAPEEVAKISDAYFGLNHLTPMIISTRERLLGVFSYQEILK